MKEIFKKISLRIKGSKRLIAVTTVCCVAAVFAVCVLAYSASYTKILPNVLVEDVRIGGMTVREAADEIEAAFDRKPNQRPITFAVDKNEKAVTFDELEARVDSKKTAETAYAIGRDGNGFKKAFKMLALMFKSESLPVEISLNDAKLDELLSALADGKEVLPEGMTYTLDGDELTLIQGHGGRMIDRGKVKEKLAKALADTEINRLELEIETLAAEKADADKFYAELTAPMKNAEYRLEDGQVVVVPEKVGIIADKAAVKAALESGKARTVITVKTQQPELTATELEELLFRDVLGTFSSSFVTSSEARASNVRLTAQRVNGKVLMPGEVFSYDKTVGSRTVANGYREAGVYIGNKTETGIGGGICQTSSTLYSAALYANLEIVSRTSHSLPVSYVPAGQDATIAEGYIDLKIKNNTEYPVKFVAEVSGRKLTCKIMGVKDPQISVELVHTRTADYEPQTERTENPEIPKGYKHIINKGAPGYAVASQRIVKQAGKVIKTEKLTRSVYRAAPVEEEVNPADKDTPSEQLKVYTPGMELEEPEAVKPEKKPEESSETEITVENTESDEPAGEGETTIEYVEEEVNV